VKTKSEGRRQNEECRSGEKLGSGIRAQPLGCRGLRQLWRTREGRQLLENAVAVRREPRRTGFEFRCPRQTVFWGWLGNLVEREEVIKCITVRHLMSPGAEGGCRKASVHAATSSHYRHFERSSGRVGYRRAEETAPCLGGRGGEAGARAGLASAGRSAEAPACGASRWIKVGAADPDLGRGRWMRGSLEPMNGKAKGLGDRNTFFICDSDERGLGLEENLRLFSLNGRKKVETPQGEEYSNRIPSARRRRVRPRRSRSPFLR
jgi:hypothetical protein